MIDHAILQKYKDSKNRKHHGIASNNGDIIGIEVDGNNKIFYIVDRGGNLIIEDWQTAQPKLLFLAHSETIIVKKP